jgi:uncharacterized integral membrane protein
MIPSFPWYYLPLCVCLSAALGVVIGGVLANGRIYRLREENDRLRKAANMESMQYDVRA